MQESSGDELLKKLASLLRKHESHIKTGQSKLCLTVTSVVYLTKCFDQLRNSGHSKSETENWYRKSCQWSVDFLNNLTKEALSLKIVPGPSPHLDVLLNISHFKNLQYLEVKKIPLGYITGLQSVRQQLKGLTCFRSVFALSEVFICCGGDLSSTPFAWKKLKEVNLSYNSIITLENSVKVLPVLEVLNLSHNNIVSPEDGDFLQLVTELKYLNLGYNRLNKVPSLPANKVPYFALKTLILRNNDIQNLKGIEYFKELETLDVSNNCIASFQELFPLAYLEKLVSLHLCGNPVCYYDDYRMRTVSCMSPLPRNGVMHLDDVKLSTLEKTSVGSNVHPVSPLTYFNTSLQMSSESQDFDETSQDLTDQPAMNVTKKKKNRKLKTRNVSIVDDVEDETKYSSSQVSSQGEPSLDHSHDIERLEKARDLGGAHWLPAVSRVLHGEQTEQQPAKEEKVDPESTSPYFVHHEDIVVDVNPPPIHRNSRMNSRRNSSTGSQHSDDEGVLQPFIVTLKTINPTDDEHDDDQEDNDLLVTVTKHFIRERNCDDGKVVCKLETGSLLSARLEESEDEDSVVHLKFDYLSRDRKERYYIMDDKENCEQLLKLLQPFIKSKQEVKDVIITEHLQCLKCSAYFTENASKSTEHICPDCGSTKIIEIHSPEARNDDGKYTTSNSKTDQEMKTEGRAESIWLKESQKMPDLIPKDSPKALLQPDIYDSNTGDMKETNTKQIEHEVFSFPDNNIDDTKVIKEPNKEPLTTLDESKSSFSIHTSSRFAINNPAGFAVNTNLFEKSSSPSRTSVLSNSIKDYETKQEENTSKARKRSSVVTPRVIDSPISLKTSTKQQNTDINVNSVIATEREDPPRKTSANQQKVTPSPSSAPNTIKTFFSKLGSKMSESVLSSSLSNGAQEKVEDSVGSKIKVVPTIESNLIFKISPDEFKNCDHRLKLYFEVSLFTGGQEEFVNCLIKAPVVVYGDTEEVKALLVVSNMAVYICKLVENAGLSATECLSRIGSYSLDYIQYVDVGLGSHSFRLEFNGESPGCCTFYVRDAKRCESFIHLLIKSANFYKADKGLIPVVTTMKNPQTLAHVRSQVLGIQLEDPTELGVRYQEQLKLFTDPPLIKDRKSLLRHYSQCFVGKEFVDWMMRYGEAKTRTEAVDCAQRLVDAGLMEHVCKECKFEDKEQFYRFTSNDDKTEDNSNETLEENVTTSSNEIDMNLFDMDTQITVAIMAYKVLGPQKQSMDSKPVTIIVTQTHVALAEENPQWPFPRFLEPPASLKGPHFHCIEKHKMTDITGLEFFTDNPCHVAVLISEEDAPLECADSYFLIQTETKDSLELLVNAIKTPWEEQFGVELQTSVLPFLLNE